MLINSSILEVSVPTLEIKITVPEGTVVNVGGWEASWSPSPPMSVDEAAELYWREYLSENTRALFRGAALYETESFGAGYSLVDLANFLKVEYKTVRSYQQTTGRVERKWREEHSTEAPIRLRSIEYRAEPGGQMRTIYGLPNGVAATIQRLTAEG